VPSLLKADIPPETPISLTEVDPDGGRYADHGSRAYCSQCGKKSTRLARSELWAIRHKTRPDNNGVVRLYCREHLPSREWVQGGSAGLTVRGDEFSCPDCWLVVRVGSPCATTGAEHRPR
jgi:hypothetical protein